MRQWRDEIPLYYEYTAGLAGERFLRGLMDGKILGGYYESCKETFLPPRVYCVSCFGEVKRFVEVPPVGKIAAITEDYGPRGGAAKKGRDRFAYITFEGVTGGMLHVVVGRAKVGSVVRPKFKEEAERRGSILDIEGFQE